MSPLYVAARPEYPNLAKATGGLIVSTGVTMAIPAAFGRIIDIASGMTQTISLPTLIPILGVYLLSVLAQNTVLFIFHAVGYLIETQYSYSYYGYLKLVVLSSSNSRKQRFF